MIPNRQSDEVRAFEAFVEDVEPRLRVAFVARYGPERGREATAEALAYAWEHWEKMKEIRNAPGYLYRVGRSRSRPRRLDNPFPETPVAGLPWIEPELAGALNRLSERQRVAVVLAHAFGWTHAEIAELLGVTPSTVQNHVDRGTTKLRRLLGVGT